MAKRQVTWFVVADDSRARLLKQRAEGPGYEIIAEYESRDAHLPSHELGADRPGRAQESAASAHHMVEPRRGPHRAHKASFAHEVAAHLNEACSRGTFDVLVLYATPRPLAELRAALDAGTKKIKAEIAKDLTKLPLPEMSRHFAELT